MMTVPGLDVIWTAHQIKFNVIIQPVIRSYLKALSDGYLPEVKRLASKQISIG